MHFLKYLKLAANILINSKLRSWLAVIGIVIGVASVIAILALGEGMQAQLEESLGGLGADTIYVTPGYSQAEASRGGFKGHDSGGGSSASSVRQKNLTNTDVQALKLIPNIGSIMGTVSTRKTIEYLSETTALGIEGVDPKVWKDMTTSKLSSGRYLAQGDRNVVVIGYSIAEKLFTQDIQINRQISIDGTPFRVVGILKESTGFGGGDKTVYMPIETTRMVFDDVGTKKFDSISIKVKNPDIIVETVEQIENKLMMIRAVNDRTRDFTVTSIQALQQEISSALAVVTLFLGAIAAISLLVGAVGIANTMFTTVLQKTKEIGIMKSVGAKNRTILLIFLINSAMIGLVGGIIGVIIGMLLSNGLPMLMGGGEGGRGMSQMFGTTIVDPITVLLVLLFSIGVGILAGLIPAYRASKMDPVDSLRYE